MHESLRHITPQQYVSSRWSGGVTTQIAIAPPGAAYADRDFLWRVSSATVELDSSDFTPLPHYQRFISTLRGAIRLRHDGGETVELAPGCIHQFDGGAATSSQGACVDFNLMLRKGACTGELRRVQLPENGSLRLAHTLDAPPDTPRTLLVYCAEGDGTLRLDGRQTSFAQGEAVEAKNAQPLLRCGAASAFLLCEIVGG